jgi:hypothetical protein
LTDQPGSGYATWPFRLVDYDGRPWIGGAIGPEFCPRWNHLAISDVILWNPLTGETRLGGEAGGTNHLIAPDMPDDRCTVFADTGAYFKAWGWRRLRLASLRAKAAAGEWLHPVTQPKDANLPGVLVIGDVFQPGWSRVTVPKLIAGAGLSPDQLFAAVLASRAMPIVEGVR